MDNTKDYYPYKVYVRVSTDKDEQISSVPNQIDVSRNWIERNGFEWDPDSVLKDEGISGTLLHEREAMQLILKKAKQREIKMVIFKSISRLARDIKDALEIREVLLGHGVRIISVEEGYDSNRATKNDISFEVWSLFADQYSRTVSTSVSAALAAKVRRGEHIGKVPYGYNRVDGLLELNPVEAPVVQQIYDWYVKDGHGMKKITLLLNERGIPSKSGGKWQMTSVQRILRNPSFCGDFVLNQYATVKVGGRKKQIRNPREKWIIFKNHHQPIVSRETWEAANMDKVSKKTRITPWNELRGLMTCAKCGSNMVAMGSQKSYTYIKCSRYRRYGKHGCVNHEPISYEALRDFVIMKLVEKGEAVTLDFKQNYNERKKDAIDDLRRQVKSTETKKKKLIDLYVEGLIDKVEFEDKRNEFDRTLQKLKDEMFIMEQAEHTEEEVRKIKQAFDVLKDTNQDLHNAFKALIDDIVIHPDGTIDISYTFQKP